MKKTLLFIALAAVLSAISIMGLMRCTPNMDPSDIPQPTEIKWDMEEESKGPARRAWFAQLHQAAEGVDWKAIEYETAMSKHMAKAAKRKKVEKRSGEEEFANGLVRGTWKERGSIDQAGSVLAMDYDPISDAIYTIGAGGSLWKRSRTVNDWTLLNDDLRFNNRTLHVIRNENGVVLFSSINGSPHFSIDEGQTWEMSAGINSFSNAFIQTSALTKNSDGENQLIILHKSGGSQAFKLYLSKDYGQSFIEISSTGNSNSRNFTLEKIAASNEVYFLEQVNSSTSRISKWNPSMEVFDVVTNNSPLGFGSGNARVNLEAVKINETTTRFYVYDMNNIIQVSNDLGATWESKGNIADFNSGEEFTPWTVGIFVPESAPNVIISGAVDALRSVDGGESFRYINRWWEYYPDPKRKMHADIMWMEEFTTSSGEKFVLINNHGGMYISYNNTGEMENISLSGLNVSQYYDVRSLPIDDNVIFAGAQDQGFQRGYIDGEGAQSFEQLISGDYGHIEFTDNGLSLWTVYPGGLVHFYKDAEFGYLTAQYTVESEDESVWIIPLMPDPDPNENIVYVAGGSADGGNGRYLIKLEYTGGIVRATNMPFNFDPFGGNITAMETDPNDENIWYVTTSNGRFFKSTDRGVSFTEEATGIPNGHYLYGADILVSKVDPNQVMVCGSGYSTPGVRLSRNGGDSFTSAIKDLPMTMIFAITYNADESLVFAATEAGPYVYVVEENTWHDISGLDVPNQTFWSVEYLPNSDIVRYGTYGRGVWDFELNSGPVSNKEVNTLELAVFPNPTSDFVQIKSDQIEDIQELRIVDYTGRTLSTHSQVNTQINVQDFVPGIYHFHVRGKNGVGTASFVKQ